MIKSKTIGARLVLVAFLLLMFAGCSKESKAKEKVAPAKAKDDPHWVVNPKLGKLH